MKSYTVQVNFSTLIEELRNELNDILNSEDSEYSIADLCPEPEAEKELELSWYHDAIETLERLQGFHEIKTFEEYQNILEEINEITDDYHLFNNGCYIGQF